MVAIRIFLSILLLISWSGCNGEKAKEKPKGGDDKNPLARGWGDSINWMELEAGIEVAKKERKPLMLIIHKTWCGACQTLKGKFAKAKMIAELAKNFIMVNAEDDEEPWEEEYYPDGGKYIPRIIFLSPDGEVLKDIINPKDEYKQYPYYYSNPAPIIHAMQSVMTRMSGDGANKTAKTGEKKVKEEKKGIEENEKMEEKEEKEARKEKDEPQPPSQKPPEKEL